uniref:Serine/threonine-protein kinase ULK3 n=2 Tax=Mesocestoides corti TaxID=53468 RepID=A0A5K3F3Q6_MESCO
MHTVLGYTLTERLGKGTYGEVYKAIHQKTRDVFAVKRIAKKSLCKRAQDNLVDEIGILKNLRHRNIAQMTDFTWDSDYVYMFMEYLGGGDLSSFLKSKRRLPERTIRYFLQQLAFALHYLFERNIVHMDIKPQNILLTNTTPPTLKLTDFGFAKSLEEPVKLNEIRGSLLYMAPEIYKFGIYEKSCDLWSVGVILFECLFGKAPFASSTIDELKAKLVDDSPIKIPRYPLFGKDCIELVSKLLKRDPSERIHHEQFFIHPFIDLAHAPCPRSLNKAVDHILIADDLRSSGNLVDAYFNYKEGLTHLISALQIENDLSRKRIIRSKLSQYIKVAEDLSRVLKERENVGSSQSSQLPVNSNLGGAESKSAVVPRDKDTKAPLHAHPESSSPSVCVKPLFIPATAMANDNVDSSKNGNDPKCKPSSVSGFLRINLLTSWFGGLASNKGNGSSPQVPEAAPGLDDAVSSLGEESTLQPAVKTAHQYALERLDALLELPSKEQIDLSEVVTGLRRFYLFLNLNEYKSAMDHLQSNFGNWLSTVKDIQNLDVQKAFRSELNEALTAAEKLKASLKAEEQIAQLPADDAHDQTCLIC